MFPFLNRYKENFNFRVKRAANNKIVNQFFRALGNAFEKIHGRPRHQASLGTINDLPTEIKEGKTKFKPKIQNPLLLQANNAKIRSEKEGRTGYSTRHPYTERVKKQPSGYRYKEDPKKAPGLVLFFFFLLLRRSTIKGQKISEGIYEVALPKMWTKKLEKFCPNLHGRIFLFFSFIFWAMQRLHILILKFSDL